MAASPQQRLHAAGADFRARFEDARTALPGASLAWLDGARAEAMERFAEQGLPSPRDEAFKFTNLAPLVRHQFALPDAGDEPVDELGVPGDGPRIVFTGGRFDPARSDLTGLEDDLEFIDLASAAAVDASTLKGAYERWSESVPDPLGDLNAALSAGGAVLRIKAGRHLSAPLWIIHTAGHHAGPAIVPSRNAILVEAGASATIVESFSGADGTRYWTHVASRIRLDDGATLRHYRVQREGDQAFHFGLTEASLAAEANFESFALSLGAELSRNEVRVRFTEPGGSCRLDGIYLARGRQHMDHTTAIDHLVPACTTSETYKGVLDDRARGVFQGRITVHPGAQKTDARQTNRNLLLSDGAQVDTKPELEIYADDVKCAHGATAGELADDALFYLRSRGIDLEAAQRLLVQAFVAEVVDEISDETAREFLKELIDGRLGTKSELQE
jgi:Fe-S cluster assembly protein SufD